MKIATSAIKNLFGKDSGIIVTNDAAEAIAKALAENAAEIAKYAVENAKRHHRSIIKPEDIESYKSRI